MLYVASGPRPGEEEEEQKPSEEEGGFSRAQRRSLRKLLVRALTRRVDPSAGARQGGHASSSSGQKAARRGWRGGQGRAAACPRGDWRPLPAPLRVLRRRFAGRRCHEPSSLSLLSGCWVAAAWAACCAWSASRSAAVAQAHAANASRGAES